MAQPSCLVPGATTKFRHASRKDRTPAAVWQPPSQSLGESVPDQVERGCAPAGCQACGAQARPVRILARLQVNCGI